MKQGISKAGMYDYYESKCRLNSAKRNTCAYAFGLHGNPVERVDRAIEQAGLLYSLYTVANA